MNAEPLSLIGEQFELRPQRIAPPRQRSFLIRQRGRPIADLFDQGPGRFRLALGDVDLDSRDHRVRGAFAFVVLAGRLVIRLGSANLERQLLELRADLG